MPESDEHKMLCDKVILILWKYGWYVRRDHRDPSIPDIEAIKDSQRWRIEIEYSGSNIDQDLAQGAQIFVTTPEKLEEIREKVKNRAPVVDLNGFKQEVKGRS